jgi:hypothetical protein
VRTRIGSTLLSRLSDEANYSEREEQFTVLCRDSDWYVIARNGTKNATLLNGKAVISETRLNAGDAITLGNASGAGKKVMRIDVQIVDE